MHGCDVVWMDVRTSEICDALIKGPAKGDKDFLRVSTGGWLCQSVIQGKCKRAWLYGTSKLAGQTFLRCSFEAEAVCFGVITTTSDMTL